MQILTLLCEQVNYETHLVELLLLNRIKIRNTNFMVFHNADVKTQPMTSYCSFWFSSQKQELFLV